MKKILVILLIIVSCLYGCQSNECEIQSTQVEEQEYKNETGNNIEEDNVLTDNPFDSFFEWCTDGTVLGVTGVQKVTMEPIIVNKQNELNVSIMNVKARKLGFKVMVDYVQVPIIVDGKSYDTYYFESKDKLTMEKVIRIDAEIDQSISHKITTILYKDLQINSSEEGKLFMNGEGVAIDQLMLYENCSNELALPNISYEKIINEYEDQFLGINISQCEDRKVIRESIHVKPGEKLQFYYHVGGFTDSTDTLIFLDIGEKQQKINGKDFLICSSDLGKIVQGKLEVKAPMKEGKYEVVAWAVNNPFGEIDTLMQDPMGCYRFTLIVEK